MKEAVTPTIVRGPAWPDKCPTSEMLSSVTFGKIREPIVVNSRRQLVFRDLVGHDALVTIRGAIAGPLQR